MKKAFFVILAVFTIFIEANGTIGSPEVSINSKGNYLIEIQMSNFASLEEEDIVLSNFKSSEPLVDEEFEFTLFENLDSYKRLTLALQNSYEDDYFSFRLSIQGKASKDIFIFLPQNSSRKTPPKEVSFKLPAKKIYGEPQRYDIAKALSEDLDNNAENDSSMAVSLKKSDVEEDKSDSMPQIINSEEVETIWSVAQSVRNNYEASIYQIMWAFYLENPKAFIDENINLVRSDIDLTVPSRELVGSTAELSAKESINFMSMQPRKISSSPGPKLVLTAPKEIFNQEENFNTGSDISLNQSVLVPVNNEDNSMLSGPEIVKKNTSIIEFGVDPNNKILDRAKTLDRAFKLNDLILVGILSLLFGFIVAFILIRLNLKASSTKTMVEEEVLDDASIFQSNLSITNDIEIQELDLVRTYIDMDDWDSAQIILDKLITTSTNESIISAAKNLLDKKK